MITPLDIMLWSILLGATSVGITVALRALPFVKVWIQEMRKPWACDVCMSFWTVGLLGLGLAWWQQQPELLVVCGPAFPWALWVLCKVTEPKGPPPPLEDSDEEVINT